MPENIPFEAAKEVNITIPPVFSGKDVNEVASHVGNVRSRGRELGRPPGNHPVSEGMEVFTHTPKVMEASKGQSELIFLSNHNPMCQTCTRSWMDCELQSLANKLSVDNVRFEGEQKSSSGHRRFHRPRPQQMYSLQKMRQRLVKEHSDSRRYRLCQQRFETKIAAPFNLSLADTPRRVNCGQCINYHPVGALQ